MSRKFHITSIDIFAALMAKGRKIGVTGLVNFAKQKCILVSKDEDRELLSEYVSQLPFDFDDIVKLYEIIESDNRREKLSITQVKKTISYDKFQHAIDSLSTQLAISGEKITILSNPDSPFLRIIYEYPHVDYGKATMLQETIVRDSIEFSLQKKDVTDIRFAANSKCKDLIKKIIDEIEGLESSTIEIDEIDLSHVTDGKRRNDFFFSLINTIPGLVLDDVSGVKISNINNSIAIENDLVDTDAEETEPEMFPATELTGFIKDVAIRGKSLLFQKEYLDFVEKGFFISNLVWRSLDKNVEPNIMVEFEAGFADHQQCKNFQYSVKGAYVFKKDKSVFSSTRKPLAEPDKIKYKTKIEQAALKSKREISYDKA
ncbi:hypothetical protein [Desulfolutivibrio sp.]|uniref:hypothetical protein n=1 Tax=Desulfolutivibrio sp. TaxID=2773296 RepID=UPI002F963C2D